MAVTAPRPERGSALLRFSASGVVSWPITVVMAVGGGIGGYAASGLAQRVAQDTVRRLIIAIGLASGLWLLADRL